MNWLLAILICLVGRATADDNAPASAPPERPITAYEREHWAYKPLVDVPVPAVDDPQWNAHPIDRFLKASMDEHGVVPLQRAGRATLLRRLSLDLTGLPPTPQQIEDFLNDCAPDTYERLIDRLLASPAYGERQAQHWLDLARFAESDGFEFDAVRPNAWRYRDWVIDALNRDMPFDEFLRWQIAGDEISDEPAAAVATGFLLCGPDMPDLNLQDERRHIVLNEMASTVGAVFLGLQVGCAQCHDHKFDPITQYDFYRLRAFFESVDMFRDHPIPTGAEAAARKAAEASWTPADHEHEKRRRELIDAGRKRHRDKNPDEPPTEELILAELTDAEHAEHEELLAQLASLPGLPELPQGRVIRDGEARASHFCLRGDFRRPGPVVNCGFPRLLAASADDPPASMEQPRTALAQWLTRPDHPLTARVIVNRVWQWHFCTGLSPTPSDFGVMGTAPDHPQLLDFLAMQFVRDGWSLKRLHRLLVMSTVYQTASAPFDHAWSAEESKAAAAAWQMSSAADPHDAYWWRAKRHRLEAETVRDAMLSASDRLSARRGGPGVRPPLPPEVTITLLKDQWIVSGDEEDHRRRSIYLFVRRNLRYPLFDVFDRPDTNATCAARHESTTAPQSLALLNSQFSLDCARELAAKLLQVASARKSQQIEQAYVRVLSRRATDEELRLGEDFLARQERALRSEGRAAGSLALLAGQPLENSYAAAALVDLCLALFNSSEFLYVD